MAITFRLNGRQVTTDADERTPLLYVLRNEFGLNGPKYGCGFGQCGACMVHYEGSPLTSCVTRIADVAGRSITTLDGLGSPEDPHPLQAAFIAEQALQCGYCVNGVIMAAATLLERYPRPTDDQIRAALHGNLCRCGSHTRMIRAIRRAAEESA